jgi:hypothetical protein
MADLHPSLTLAAETFAALASTHAGAAFSVRQQGTYALSEALSLMTLG